MFIEQAKIGLFDVQISFLINKIRLKISKLRGKFSHGKWTKPFKQDYHFPIIQGMLTKGKGSVPLTSLY